MPHDARRRTWLALLAIFALAACIRFAFWFELRGTALDQWQRFDESDMATYIEQARRIRADDLLQPEPYHPYHPWQRVAPEEKWLSWYGPHAFHQAPLYAYLIALVMPFAGAEYGLIKAVQLLLGAGTCVLLYLIARKLWNETAGWAAGLLAACYGPLLYLEAQLLREGPAQFFILATLYALLVHLERETADARRQIFACAGLGLAAGAFSMFHEMGIVLSLVLVTALASGHLRAGAKWVGLAVAGLLAGWVVGFSPLLARNVAVGAAPLSVSSRTTLNFVASNVADAANGGATFGSPSPLALRVLDDSKGSALTAVAGVWKSYGGDLGLALTNLGARFAANWRPWEVPDNTSYEFYREYASTLRFAPTFGVVFPLGLAGLALTVWHLIRGSRAAVASHLAVLLLLAALVGALSLVHTVARFRMYLVPLWILYAASAIAILRQMLRERRFGPVAALALLTLGGVLVQRAMSSKVFVQGPRTLDYATACTLSIEGGRIDEARGFAERARQNFPTDELVYLLAGHELEQKGDRPTALEFYRRALEIKPEQPFARDAVHRLEPR